MNEELLKADDDEIIVANRPLSSVQMLRSELAQEIISRKAGFLEKWSLLIFLGILVLVFGGTWFVQYPDVITTSAVLTAENRPKEITIRQEGRLIKLFVNNNQFLKKSDIIGWIESSADHNQVNELSNEIDKSIDLLTQNEPQKISSIIKVNFYKLGEIQSDYQQLLLAEEAFNNYISSGTNFAKTIADHRPDRVKIAFEKQLLLLKNEIQAWSTRYILQAPIDGKITLTETIKQNDYLRAGTLLGYILPTNSKYFMETILPQNNFGKLDTGLHVQIRLEAYPYEEWGFLNGTINYISSVPVGNGFMATIKLDNGLVTNNQKNLPYRNGLRAQAIIITKDIRLLQKFYYGFVKSSSVNK
ncbi:MAG TPA: HlyD family efflux transporter periplasmic adaptor subunit [Mucilaginibacter sp.]|jgi:multidrug efflux pump subunit AcrA (membrane-fusion protein)|nr:HlyD family efflux transporter periplasmic adaptor subunit [Mucilaginibacter sp.]